MRLMPGYGLSSNMRVMSVGNRLDGSTPVMSPAGKVTRIN